MPLTPTGVEIDKLNIRLCARRTMDVRIRIGHLLETVYAVTRVNNPYRTPLVSCTQNQVISAGPRERSLQSGFLHRDADCRKRDSSVALPAQAIWPKSQEGKMMNITINASGNSNVTITGNENLISNDTTFGELLTILRTRPEAAEASKTEQAEKKREEDMARLCALLGEDFESAATHDDAAEESPLVKEKRRPGAVQLRTSVPRIARIQIGADSLCEVFSNGYAVYDNGDRKTVLWVPDCGTYTYYFGQLRDNEKQYLKEKEVLDMEVLGALPWYNVLVLFGETQIENNLDHPKSKGTSSDAEVPEEWEVKPAYRWICGAHFDSPEEAFIKKEEAEERRRALTDKQRRIYELYYEEGYTQEEIAQLLNIGQNAVHYHLKSIGKRLQKDMEKFL